MPVSPNDPRPAYLQIADELRRAIEGGELAPGQRLPSGRKLAEQYGVAVMTIKQALRELDDLLISWQGRGVFVREQPTSTSDPLSQIIGQLEDLRGSVQDLETRLSKLEAERPKRR